MRTGTLELQGDGLGISPVRLGSTGNHRSQGHCVSQHVRQRQEGQNAVTRTGNQANLVGEDGAGLRQPVAVQEHAALRTTSGTGGVNHGCQVVGLGVLDAALDLVAVNVTAFVANGVSSGSVNLQYTTQLRLALRVLGALFDQQRLHAVGVLTRLGKCENSTGVFNNPTNLARRRRAVNRDNSSACHPDSGIDQVPLVASLTEQRYAVARLNTVGN